jgi:hypothetical protein
MKSLWRQCLSIWVSYTVWLLTFSGTPVFANGHVVPLKELHQKLQSTAEARAKNVADVERVLSYPASAEALKKYNVNGDQMRAAVATLSDAELEHFAARARASEKDVQGGLIVGLLALIGLVVVIIVVVHAVSELRLPANSGVENATPVPQVAPVNG